MADTNIGKKSTGSGVTVEISTDGAEYKKFGSVSGVTPPSMSRGTVDVTDLNSYADNNKFKEYLADFVEGGTMTVNGYFINGDEGRNAADAAFYGDGVVYIRMVMPTVIGKTLTFVGIPTSYQPLGEVNTSTGLAFSFGITVTQKPTIADTTA